VECDDVDLCGQPLGHTPQKGVLDRPDAAAVEEDERPGEHGHEQADDPDGLRGQRVEDERDVVVVPADVLLGCLVLGERVHDACRGRRDGIGLPLLGCGPTPRVGVCVCVGLSEFVETVEDGPGLLGVVVFDGALGVSDRLGLREVGEHLGRRGLDPGRVQFVEIDLRRVARAGGRRGRSRRAVRRGRGRGAAVAGSPLLECPDAEVEQHDDRDAGPAESCDRPANDRGVQAENAEVGRCREPVGRPDDRERLVGGPEPAAGEVRVQRPGREDERAGDDVPAVAHDFPKRDGLAGASREDEQFRQPQAEPVQRDQRHRPHDLGEGVRRGEHRAEDEHADDGVAPPVPERLVGDHPREGQPAHPEREL